jgi:hypothetical protein
MTKHQQMEHSVRARKIWMIVTLDVTFESDVFIESISEYASGFIQILGITAKEFDARNEIIDEVTSDIKYAYSISHEVSVFSESEINKKLSEDLEIRESLLKSIDDYGIWYKSGKGFYRNKLHTKFLNKIIGGFRFLANKI